MRNLKLKTISTGKRFLLPISLEQVLLDLKKNKYNMINLDNKSSNESSIVKLKNSNSIPINNWEGLNNNIINNIKSKKMNDNPLNQENIPNGFYLKTSAGCISFKADDKEDYSNFIRNVIEILISFNTSDIDTVLSYNIKKAIELTNNNNTFDDILDDVFDELEEYDNIRSVENIKEEKEKKRTEAIDYVSNLPSSYDFKITILPDGNNENELIENIIKEKCTSKFSSNQLKNIIENRTPIILSQNEALDLYIELRINDIFVHILPFNKKDNEIKKNKKITKSIITGKEKIPVNIGIIDNALSNSNESK